MNYSDFRKHIAEKIEELLLYWKEIEEWIKIAEQINKKAVVPAINELRYAGRFLVHAVWQFRGKRLNDEAQEQVRESVSRAQQCLMNADYDLTDAILTFYRKAVSAVDNEIGISIMIEHFSDYPK